MKISKKAKIVFKKNSPQSSSNTEGRTKSKYAKVARVILHREQQN